MSRVSLDPAAIDKPRADSKATPPPLPPARRRSSSRAMKAAAEQAVKDNDDMEML
jgi:hypothetical protein